MEDNLINSKLKLTSVAIIWGLTFGSTKIGLEYANPYTYNFFRFFIAAIILLPFVKKISAKDRGFVILFSIIYSFSVVFQTLSLVTNQTINTSNLMGTSIVITASLGFIIFKETPNFLVIIMVIIGISLLTNFKYFFNGIGDFYALISSVFYGSQVFLVSYITKRRDVDCISILFYQSFAALILNAVFISIFGFSIDPTPLLMGTLVYNVFFSLILATIIQFKYQKYVNVYEASIIYIISDIIIILIGFLMGEKVMFYQLLGCLLIISAPFINTLHFKKRGGNKDAAIR